jgi:hypothetical protein
MMSMSFGQINRVGDPIPFEADPNLPVMPAIPRGRTNCGDIDMRIAVDGTWFHEGTPIGRRELVKLFAKVLTRDKAGRFWLVTPAEMARIQVEDAPFLAVELAVADATKSSHSARTSMKRLSLIRIIPSASTPIPLRASPRHMLPCDHEWMPDSSAPSIMIWCHRERKKSKITSPCLVFGVAACSFLSVASTTMAKRRSLAHDS